MTLWCWLSLPSRGCGPKASFWHLVEQLVGCTRLCLSSSVSSCGSYRAGVFCQRGALASLCTIIWKGCQQRVMFTLVPFWVRAVFSGAAVFSRCGQSSHHSFRFRFRRLPCTRSGSTVASLGTRCATSSATSALSSSSFLIVVVLTPFRSQEGARSRSLPLGARTCRGDASRGA